MRVLATTVLRLPHRIFRGWHHAWHSRSYSVNSCVMEEWINDYPDQKKMRSLLALRARLRKAIKILISLKYSKYYFVSQLPKECCKWHWELPKFNIKPRCTHFQDADRFTVWWDSYSTVTLLTSFRALLQASYFGESFGVFWQIVCSDVKEKQKSTSLFY